MSEQLKLFIERDFDAPIDRVWQSWTDPKLLQLWSCPETFEVTNIDGELKVGGEWHMAMESKTLGFSGKLKGSYRLLDRPKKIVSTHIWLADDGHEDMTEYTVVLSENGDRTHMVFTQTGFANNGSIEGHSGGWNECFAKLTTILESE
jgi:uncharacterized protein YndB with AHSA1/START domain